LEDKLPIENGLTPTHKLEEISMSSEAHLFFSERNFWSEMRSLSRFKLSSPMRIF
jgi:hypothetical protein